MGEKPSSRASGVAGKHAVHGDRMREYSGKMVKVRML